MVLDDEIEEFVDQCCTDQLRREEQKRRERALLTKVCTKEVANSPEGVNARRMEMEKNMWNVFRAEQTMHSLLRLRSWWNDIWRPHAYLH